MRLTETVTGERITMRMVLDILGTYYAAELDGRTRYAVIDGLLWWAIRRQVDAFAHLALAQAKPDAVALNTAESLNHYVWHLDFENTSNTMAVRIMVTVAMAVEKLAPLATDEKAATLLDQLERTVKILQQRMDDPGAALLGVEDFIQPSYAA